MTNLNAIFEEAVSIVKTLPPSGKFQLTKEQKLELEGLWKQATDGDCKEPEPKDKQAAKEHDAWASHKGMNQDDAKNKYVAALKKALKDADEGDSKTLLDQLSAAA